MLFADLRLESRFLSFFELYLFLIIIILNSSYFSLCVQKERERERKREKEKGEEYKLCGQREHLLIETGKVSTKCLVCEGKK